MEPCQKEAIIASIQEAITHYKESTLPEIKDNIQSIDNQINSANGDGLRGRLVRVEQATKDTKEIVESLPSHVKESLDEMSSFFKWAIGIIISVIVLSQGWLFTIARENATNIKALTEKIIVLNK